MYLYTHMAGEPNTASMPGLKAEKYELLFTQWHLEMKYKPTELCLYTNDRNPDLYCERKCVLRFSGFIPNVVLRLFSNSPQIAPHCPQIVLRFSPIVLRLSLDSAQIVPCLCWDSPRLSSDCPPTLLRLLRDCPRRNETVLCHVCASAQTRVCCIATLTVYLPHMYMKSLDKIRQCVGANYIYHTIATVTEYLPHIIWGKYSPHIYTWQIMGFSHGVGWISMCRCLSLVSGTHPCEGGGMRRMGGGCYRDAPVLYYYTPYYEYGDRKCAQSSGTFTAGWWNAN